MHYIDFVSDTIRNAVIGTPIYTKKIAYELMNIASMENSAAQAAVSVAIKRIRERNLIPELQMYQKGLKYDLLLALADKYYNQQTILQLAHTTSIEGAGV